VRVAIKTGVTDGNMTEVDGLDPGREVIVDVVRDKGKAPAAGGAGRGMLNRSSGSRASARPTRPARSRCTRWSTWT
jgi:hypothetical protein